MTQPLALLEDPALLDELLRLAAAADCELQCVPNVATLRPLWHTAPMVLLDPAGMRACIEADLPRRSGVFVVHDGDPPYQEAVCLGVERLLTLAGASDWLVGAFADIREGPPDDTGRVLALLGGRGGAGASVLAAAVGRAVVSGGGEALLVDCDPLGGGIDLAVGAETVAGARWPSVKVSGGRVPISALRTALPAKGSLTVLSCAREGPGPEPQAVAAVLEAGRRGGCTVICDLPRQLTPAAGAALDRADLAVLVVPAEVRATAAARRVAERVHDHGTKLRVVVRGPAPGGLRADQVAEVLGVPLLTQMRAEPRLAAVLDRGEFPARTHGPLAAGARAVLKELRA